MMSLMQSRAWRTTNALKIHSIRLSRAATMVIRRGHCHSHIPEKERGSFGEAWRRSLCASSGDNNVTRGHSYAVEHPSDG